MITRAKAALWHVNERGTSVRGSQSEVGARPLFAGHAYIVSRQRPEMLSPGAAGAESLLGLDRRIRVLIQELRGGCSSIKQSVENGYCRDKWAVEL